jgi:hypothetical protein
MSRHLFVPPALLCSAESAVKFGGRGGYGGGGHYDGSRGGSGTQGGLGGGECISLAGSLAAASLAAGSALRSDHNLLKYLQEALDSIIDLTQWSPNYHERQRRRPDTEICIALGGVKFKSSVRAQLQTANA